VVFEDFLTLLYVARWLDGDQKDLCRLLGKLSLPSGLGSKSLTKLNILISNLEKVLTARNRLLG
jgi:hypothetical protein